MDTVSDVLGKMDVVGTQVQYAINSVFKKSLADLVRGIRANSGNESKYINEALQEIKEELKSTDKDEKTNAIQKLTYLQMLGYNMDWASFKIIEVISHQKFSHKRIGYLAATQTFSENTDVMVLVTNLIRKDCLSPNMYDGGLALDCLANICTTELARDLVPDIVNMLTSARPYIRKKAVLAMYKIFLKFPDALRPSFNRLKDKLDDADPSVVNSAVNVICELARKNAKNYLSLAPTLFKLLTKSTNNWMLIKIIKLFAILIPIEERLGKKLGDPLCNIINSTNSMSLMYEAIFTCIIGLSYIKPVMQLCISKLRMFIEHPDQNLKYLGLLALSKIMEKFPRGISEHRDVILTCLEDEDQTIRLRAVELLTGMVDRKNIAFIVDKLRQYLETAEGPYRDELLEKIIYICSQEKYKHISDFEWYLGVLMELTSVKGVKNGKVIADQIFDVCVRVKVVRPVAVRHMISLLQDPALMTEDPREGGMCEALLAAAWVVGEYAEYIQRDHLHVIELLTQHEVLGLPAHIQSVFIMNSFKILCSYATAASGELPVEAAKRTLPSPADLEQAITYFEDRLPPFCASSHVEVQERACFIQELLRLVKEQGSKGVKIASELCFVAEEPMNPVGKESAERVVVPQNLDLDAWIHEPMPPEVDAYTPSSYDKMFGLPYDDYEDSSSPWQYIENEDLHGDGFSTKPNMAGGYSADSFGVPTRRRQEMSQDEKAEQYRQRKQENSMNINYIVDDDIQGEVGAPVVSFAEQFPDEARILRNKGVFGPDDGGQRARNPRGRGRAAFVGRGPRNLQPVHIITDEENPEGWTKEKEDAKRSKQPQVDPSVDPLGAIDLTVKPDVEVALPVRQHRSHAQDHVKLPPKLTTGGPSAAPVAGAGRPPLGGRGPPGGPRGRGPLTGRAPLRGRPIRGGLPVRGGRPPRGRPAPGAAPAAAPATPSGPASRSTLPTPAVTPGLAPVTGAPAKVNATGAAPRGRGARGGRVRGRGERGRGARGAPPPGGRGRGPVPPTPADEKPQQPEQVTPASTNGESTSESNPLSIRPLANDSNLEITYDMQVNRTKTDRIVVTFYLSNKGDGNISELSFKFEDTPNNHVALETPHEPSEPIKVEFSLAPGQSNTFEVPFTYESMLVDNKPQEVHGTLNYTVKEEKANLPINLKLGPSAFIIPENIEKSAFTTLARGLPNFESKKTHNARSSLQQAVNKISAVFKVKVVEESENKRASLYGKTVSGQHVAFFILIDPKDPQQLVVNIKTEQEPLSDSILEELGNLQY